MADLGRHFVATAALGVALASLCRAQRTVAFDIRFSDPVLVPGESQEIEVWAVLNPGVGQSLGSGYPSPALVEGFAGATFDLVNELNGQTGLFSALALNPALGGMGTLPAGTPDAQGNVIGAQPGQFHPPFLVSAANPILLWRADWTPSDYTPRTVAFSTRCTAGPWVWVNVGASGFLNDPWESAHSPSVFTIVPGPGTALLLFGATLWPHSSRRRGR